MCDACNNYCTTRAIWFYLELLDILVWIVWAWNLEVNRMTYLWNCHKYHPFEIWRIPYCRWIIENLSCGANQLSFTENFVGRYTVVEVLIKTYKQLIGASFALWLAIYPFNYAASCNIEAVTMMNDSVAMALLIENMIEKFANVKIPSYCRRKH